MRRRLPSRFISSLFIFLLLFLIIRAPLLAQSAAVVLHEVNLDSFPTANVVVSTWNGSQPITNLSADDFTLVEDGQIAPIQELTSLDSSQVPISLILVLDTSTSMQANNAINDAKAAAFSILDRLKPNDRVALLAFAAEINLNVDLLDSTRELAFTTDKEQVRAAIAGLQADGPTPLYDATVKAIGLSANEAAGSRGMILLTDGRDEVVVDGLSQPASVLTADDAVNQARDASMPIFTIGLGDSIDEPFLQRLANQSGGTFANAPTSDQLNVRFNEAFDRLLQRYVIRYQSNAPPNGEPHALQVQLNKDGQSASGQATFIAPLPDLPDVPVVNLNYTDNQQVQGDVTIQPIISARDPIVNVQLLVDGEVVDQSNSEPYALIWRSGEARWLEPPNHTITVQVTDDGGDVGERSVPLVVLPPASTPSEEPVATEIATVNNDETIQTPEVSSVSPEAEGAGEAQAEEAGEAQAEGAGEAAGEAQAEGAGTGEEEAGLFQFLLSNWMPFSLFGLAGLLFIAVLFIWMRDRRNRSTDNVLNSPPPLPQPVAESFLSVPPKPSPSFSPSASFSDHAYDDKSALESAQSLPSNSATVLPGHLTPVNPPVNPPLDPPLDKTVILGKKQRLPSLIVIEGPDKRKTFNILQEQVTIGRGKEGEITLSDGTVSRKQAIIKIENEEYFLYNRSKSNFTYLNGEQVKGRMPLRDRDRIEMGNTTLQFIDP